MTKRIIFFTILIICLNLMADRIDDIITDIPGIDEYPNASALNVLTEINLDITEDFSYTYHVFYVKKILNYKGKKRYSDVKISYNGDNETIELGNCFTIDTKGNRIEIPENQIYDMNDTESIQSPDYINFREKIINFPQIEPGYFIVLDYTRSNNRCEPVSGIEHLRETNPYLQKTFSITYPAELNINTYFDESIVTSSEQEKNDFKTLSWSVRKAEIYKEENNSPSLLMAGTPIVYSFYNDWQELASQKLVNLKDVEITPEIEETAISVTKNCKTEDEKFLALYKFLAENFNEKKAYISEIDFGPEPMTGVWQKKFGSQRELTALFLSMLNSVGITDAYPAVILLPNNRSSYIQKNLPVTDFMKRISVYWNDNLYCPGNSYKPFGYAGVIEANVLIGNDKFEMIEYNGNQTVIEDYHYHYLIKDNAANVKVKSLYSSNMNDEKRRWFLDQTDAQRKIWFNRSLREKSAILVDGPNFKNFDKIDEDLEITFTLRYDDFVVDQTPYKYFKLISPALELDVDLDERENDYQVFTKVYIKQEFDIEIDAGSTRLLNEVDQLKEFRINDTTAYFKMSSKANDSGIKIEKEIYIPEFIVPVERYKEFKQFILKIKNPLNDMIFME